MRRLACLLLVIFILDKGVFAPSSEKCIMVDTFEAIKSKEDVVYLIENAQRHDVTTIFLLGKKRDGDRSGHVIFESSYAPPFYDWDVLKDFASRAKEAKIKIYVWLPLLYDNYLFKQKDFGISNGWVSPINEGVKSYLQGLVSELGAYEIEGILLDDLAYEDEYSASRELQNLFNETFNYENLTYSLPAEKERNSPIWKNWLLFKRTRLNELFGILSGKMEGKKIGIVVPPSAYFEENLEGVDISGYGNLSLVAVKNGEGLKQAVNGFYLQSDADVFIIIENDNVRTTRDMTERFRDIIFFSKTWNRLSFERMEKGSYPFSTPQVAIFSLMDYFNNPQPTFVKSGIDTVVLQAGNPASVMFFFDGRPEVWSPYVRKYRKDYVDDYLQASRKQGLNVVLEVDASSSEYVLKYPQTAAFDYTGMKSRSRVSIQELTDEEGQYRKQLLDTLTYLSSNYEADAVLLSGVSYRNEDFGQEAFSSYAGFMRTLGNEVADWPRKTGGEIDIFDKNVGDWKTHQMEKLLSECARVIHENNKEFWIFVEVSWENPGLQSKEFGLYLPMLEKYADRIILNTDFNFHSQPSSYFLQIAKNLPTVHSERYTPLVYLTQSPEDLRKALTDITNLKFYSFGIVPYSSFTTPYRDISYKMSYKQEVDFSSDIQQLWENGFYDEIQRVYKQLLLEEAFTRERERKQAKEDFKEAFQKYEQIEKTILEAEKYDIATDDFKASFSELKTSLDESRSRFLEESFSESSRISNETLSFSEKLHGEIKKAIDKKLSERTNLAFAILLLFFIILLFTSQYLRRRK